MYLHIYISLKAIFLLHIGFGVKRSLFQHIKSEYISTLYSSQALMHKYILWQKKFRIKILVEINKVTQILEPTLHFQKCFFSPSPRQTVQNSADGTQFMWKQFSVQSFWHIQICVLCTFIEPGIQIQNNFCACLRLLLLFFKWLRQ